MSIVVTLETLLFFITQSQIIVHLFIIVTEKHGRRADSSVIRQLSEHWLKYTNDSKNLSQAITLAIRGKIILIKLAHCVVRFEGNFEGLCFFMFHLAF